MVLVWYVWFFIKLSGETESAWESGKVPFGGLKVDTRANFPNGS